MNCIHRLEYHNQVAQIRLSVDSMSFHRTHPRLRSVHMPALPLHKQVYTPFSIADPWKLIGANEEVKQKYEKYYERIRLREKMESIFYQYHKYANVYIY